MKESGKYFAAVVIGREFIFDGDLFVRLNAAGGAMREDGKVMVFNDRDWVETPKRMAS